MSTSSLTINFSAASAPEFRDSWVRLEQIMPSEAADYASLADVHAMWLAAATGRSARLLRSLTCPLEFDGTTIRIFLGFYAWPSSPSLPFSLSVAMGEISAGQVVRQQREFSLFIDNRTGVDLDYYMEGISLVWETPSFLRTGEEIDAPTFTLVNGNRLEFSSEVFGAIRVSGIAVGMHHVVSMELSKPVEDVPAPADYTVYPDNTFLMNVPPVDLVASSPKIENLENTVTASWLDQAETETEQLRLALPKCVAAVLAMCPDMYQTITLLCQEVSTLSVYYNACTGAVIAAVSGADPQKFCTQIGAGETVVANPWGVGTL